jgi:hypothetical protein
MPTLKRPLDSDYIYDINGKQKPDTLTDLQLQMITYCYQKTFFKRSLLPLPTELTQIDLDHIYHYLDTQKEGINFAIFEYFGSEIYSTYFHDYNQDYDFYDDDN